MEANPASTTLCFNCTLDNELSPEEQRIWIRKRGSSSHISNRVHMWSILFTYGMH